MAKASVEVKFDADFAKEFNSAMNQLESHMRINAIDEAVKEGAKPVVVAVKRFVPHGDPADRKKMSSKVRNKWKNYQPLHKVIQSVIRKGKYGAMAVIGASYSRGGGHANLFASDHKRWNFWDRSEASGKLVRKFMKLAHDDSKQASLAAMRASLKASLERFRVRG